MRVFRWRFINDDIWHGCIVLRSVKERKSPTDKRSLVSTAVIVVACDCWWLWLHITYKVVEKLTSTLVGRMPRGWQRTPWRWYKVTLKSAIIYFGGTTNTFATANTSFCVACLFLNIVFALHRIGMSHRHYNQFYYTYSIGNFRSIILF